MRLTQRVIGAALEVHRDLGPGYLESVYAAALSLELKSAGLPYRREQRLVVRYKKTEIGHFFADLVVAERLLIELKAVSSLVAAHEAQVLSYLRSSGLPLALLLNFGGRSLQVKRLVSGFVPTDDHY